MEIETMEVPGKNSIDLYEKSKIIGKAQNAIQSGSNNHIIDEDGNKYLDFFSGAKAKILNNVINEVENKRIPDSTIEKFKRYSCGSLCSTCWGKKIKEE